MSAPERLLVLAFLGAINHQVTYILVEGSIFEPQRAWIARRSAWLGMFVRCALCTGTWIGFLMALVFRPALLPVRPVAGWSAATNATFRAAAAFAADALLIAFVGRVFNEVLAIFQREVKVKEETAEFLDQMEREAISDVGLRIAD